MKSRNLCRVRYCLGTILVLVLHAQLWAGTVIKLDLGNDSSNDVQLTDVELETVDDGVGANNGEQNSAVIFLDLLKNAHTDIAFGSFTLDGVQLAGKPTVIGTEVIMQPTTGGKFEIWDENDELILSGTLLGGILSGPLGLGATGGFLTTTLGVFDGGSLQQYLDPNSASLAFSLTNVNGGQGFSTIGSGDDQRLAPFTAHATANLGARGLVPEPQSGVLLGLGLLGLLASRRRRSP
jgi:hypothetical protein